MTSPIDHTDTSLPDPQALRLAKLFDLRTFIGALFVIFGVVVTIEGLVASQASIAKAAGVNLSLWTGLSMLALGVIFILWMLARPPSLEVKHEDLSHAPERGHH
jgi:amino acid transporter